MSINIKRHFRIEVDDKCFEWNSNVDMTEDEFRKEVENFINMLLPNMITKLY